MQTDLLRRILTDPETGLPNDRFLDLERERITARAVRYGFPVGVMTISCDGCGQDILRRFCRTVSGAVRRADFLARTGPTELQLLVTHRDTEGLPALVERLRQVAAEFAGEGFEIEVGWTIEQPAEPA